MEILSFEKVSFRYPQGRENALQEVSFQMEEGEFAVLFGPSGCGKSTLLEQLKGELAPRGWREGRILYRKEPVENLTKRIQCEKIGFVGQSPDNQLVTDKVWHELAFGLESLGVDTPSIRIRVGEIAGFFGMESWFEKDVSLLSGGQKQILNLASVMVMGPDLLVLDEPLSRLDPIAAEEFIGAIGKVNRELGTTILLTEHRLEEVLPYADRILVMEEGKIRAQGTLKSVARFLKKENSPLFCFMPAPVRVWQALSEEEEGCPETVGEGRKWLEGYVKGRTLRPLPGEAFQEPDGPLAVEMKEVCFRYEKGGPDILKGLNLKLWPGEFLAVLGGNGAGKSTMLSLLSGNNKPYRGKIFLKGQPAEDRLLGQMVGALPQNPQALFTQNSVWLELMEMVSDTGLSGEEQKQEVEKMLKLCRLEKVASRHPYDLSGGEMQRTALAKVLLKKPEILLLDEPTKGMDAGFKKVFAGIIKELLNKKVAILMVSHDVEFCASLAHRCGLLFRGELLAENTAQSFFGQNLFYTTSARRMAQRSVPEAVTAEQILYACGVEGSCPEDKPVKQKPIPQIKTEEEEGEPSGPLVPAKKNRRTPAFRLLAQLFCLFCLIPATIFAGINYLGDEKYVFISLLILLEGMFPFFLSFEKRRPQARELVFLAVLCGLGVAGRMVTYMLPQFKPVAALTILVGVAFGGETGFLVGSITMLASNVFFQQGPWTPWQMFAMGLVGYLAGIIGRGWLKRHPFLLCGAGFFLTLVFYGGIMNFASGIMARAPFDWPSFAVYFAAGFPMDVIHGLSTGVFLFFLAKPALQKLERVENKYGLFSSVNFK